MPADGSQTSTDPATQKVELQKARAELRKLRAEARQAELPALPSEVPSGTVDAGDKGSPIGVLAAYRALDLNVGPEIAGAIPDDVVKVWIVPDDRASRYQATHDLVSAELRRFARGVKEAAKALPSETTRRTLLPAAVLFAAQALPMLMSFFKSDVSIRGRDVTMSFNAVALDIAKHVKAGKNPPAVFIAGVSATESGPLTTKARSLEAARDVLARELDKFRGAKVTEPSPDLAASTETLASAKAILQAEAEKATPKGLEKLARNVTDAARKNAEQRQGAASDKALADAVQDIIDTVDAFLEKLRTTDASGMTPLSIADTYESIGDAHTLFLEASFAGGESVYEEVTARKDRGLHLGCVVVSHALIAPDGTIVSTGITTGERAATTRVGEPKITWQA